MAVCTPMNTRINRLSMVGWILMLIGILILASQWANGGRSDWMFDVALGFLIGSTVLRVYGKYGRK